jgi:hypothetical protein
MYTAELSVHKNKKILPKINGYPISHVQIDKKTGDK